MVCKTTCFTRPWAQFIFSFMSNWPLAHSFIRVKLAFGPFIHVKTASGPFIHVKPASGPFIHVKTASSPSIHSCQPGHWPIHSIIQIKLASGPLIWHSNIVHQSKQRTYKTYIEVSNLDYNIF